MQATLTNHPDARCEVTLENPLCATGFRSERHRRILELEEQITRGQATRRPRSQMAPIMEELAGLHHEEAHHEKAIDWARHAMKADQRPSVHLLNLTAMSYEQLGAPDRAEKHYKEAIRVGQGSTTPRFNLSLLLERQDRREEALEQIEEVVRLRPGEGAHHVQRGTLLKKLGRRAEGEEALHEGVSRLDREAPVSRWQRVWRGIAASALGDEATAKRLEREAARARCDAPAFDAEKLPAQRGTLTRRRGA